VCWSFCVVGLEWYPCCSLKHASACNTDTTPNQPHRISNTHRTKNNTTNVVIQQNSRKLLLMDILISEICWAHKKWNKIASDIKLVFYSSTITMMHGPINIRFLQCIRLVLSLPEVCPWESQFYLQRYIFQDQYGYAPTSNGMSCNSRLAKTKNIKVWYSMISWIYLQYLQAKTSTFYLKKDLKKKFKSIFLSN